jgi:insertion element IS1 protein InsB
VTYALRDGFPQTLAGLWEAIQSTYHKGHYFTDFWAAYAAVRLNEQHTAVGKETGENAHIEHWNNTLRQT